MEKKSNPSMATRIREIAARVTCGRKWFAERRRLRVAHPPDAHPDIYSHLQWIGPGTFLVSAYIHKQLGY
jgi:hypothetical protein